MSKMTDEEIVGLAAGFIEMTNDVYVDFMPSNLIAFARAIEARSLPANERVRDEAYERAAKACEGEFLAAPAEGTCDAVYDRAVQDCIGAIRALIGKGE